MKELRAAKAAGEDEERAYDLAIKASMREAERVLTERKEDAPVAESASSSSPRQSRSLSRSIDKPNQQQQQERAPPPALPPRQQVAEDYDAELQRALSESQISYDEDSIRREQREKEEIDIVLDFVKRQSLAELEHKQRTPAEQGNAEN